MIQIGAHQICKNCLKSLSHQYIRKKWTSATLRQSFIDFFCQNHDHQFVKSSPVIPYRNQGTYFTNAGMNQFKPIFLDTIDSKHPMADYRRVVNSQKCIRVGGKHNDLEDVGKDVFHHTFFEMLGSWSFGDYFKTEACTMALELLTTVYKIPVNRLYFTYFGGDDNLGLESDTETRDIWRSLGIPAERIIPCGSKDNFWDMGDTGPCGPCTEIHYDHTGNPDSINLVNKGLSDVIEIWNLVFMQYNRRTDGTLESLNKVHVDTGMGLERILAVMNQTSSTYNTDLFIPIFSAIQKCSNIRPYEGLAGDQLDTAYRIVADHIRMASVCIADGLLPGNKNQGFKLRTVLFRCFNQSKKILGMPQRSIPSLVDIVVDSLKGAYPELEKNQDKIKDVICDAEMWYDETLQIGQKAFQKYQWKYPNQKHLTDQSLMDIIDGKFTDGFCIPVDLLPELGTAYHVTLDMEGLHQRIDKRLKESAQQLEDTQTILLSPETLNEIIQMGVKPTDDGYKYKYSKQDDKYYFPQEATATITNIVKDDNLFTEAVYGEDFGILLDKTIFYGEGGGQSADVGYIQSCNGMFKVTDVQIFNNYVLHIGHMETGKLCVGDTVTLNIDEEHRLGCMKNHTATHILNSCLRKMYKNVSQEGSRIYPDKFSFNFSSTTRMNPEDLFVIQEKVQEVIDSDMVVSRELYPLEIALQIPDLISLKNEHYPGEVYTVSLIQEMDDLSTELCAGTHVKSTSDIEAFCIISASMSSLGIKRLTCLTGKYAEEAIDRGIRLLCEYGELSAMIESESQPETWQSKVKQINKELGKDLPKLVHEDLRQKVDRLGDPIKMVLNKIKKTQLKQVISAKLEECTDSLCTVTTDINITPQVMNQVLTSVKSDRPIVIMSSKDKNAPIFVCFNKDIEMKTNVEQELQSMDIQIKVKKTLKKDCVILHITCKDKSLDNTSSIYNTVQSAFNC